MGATPWLSTLTTLDQGSIRMAKRKGETTKISAVLDVELHAKLSAAAALRRTTKNAILVEALAVHLSSVIAFDRVKKTGHDKGKDRPIPEAEINPDVENEAA